MLGASGVLLTANLLADLPAPGLQSATYCIEPEPASERCHPLQAAAAALNLTYSRQP